MSCAPPPRVESEGNSPNAHSGRADRSGRRARYDLGRAGDREEARVRGGERLGSCDPVEGLAAFPLPRRSRSSRSDGLA